MESLHKIEHWTIIHVNLTSWLLANTRPRISFYGLSTHFGKSQLQGKNKHTGKDLNHFWHLFQNCKLECYVKYCISNRSAVEVSHVFHLRLVLELLDFLLPTGKTNTHGRTSIISDILAWINKLSFFFKTTYLWCGVISLFQTDLLMKYHMVYISSWVVSM